MTDLPRVMSPGEQLSPAENLFEEGSDKEHQSVLTVSARDVHSHGRAIDGASRDGHGRVAGDVRRAGVVEVGQAFLGHADGISGQWSGDPGWCCCRVDQDIKVLQGHVHVLS